MSLITLKVTMSPHWKGPQQSPKQLKHLSWIYFTFHFSLLLKMVSATSFPSPYV